ncbi:MAG: ABC transporter substrate-binding protein [bacterium]|jgi:branched-chain amino acid transport system substrate-binding protein
MHIVAAILGAFGLLLLSSFDPVNNAAAGKLRIYLDADRTGVVESGKAIEWGIRTALSEVQDRLGGHEVELVIRDHRGNTRRSTKHLEEYLEDKHALVVFSGLHSPPLLANLAMINEEQILVLDPWAAAGPITRHPTRENWIFRLSIDDTKAGRVISQHAILRRGHRAPALLLEKTGWGKSNERTMTAALKDLKADAVSTTWFNWGLTEESARIILRDLARSGADVIFFVGNAPEGKTFARAMTTIERNLRRPICSHWGITGGDFPEVIGADLRATEGFSLEFLQTSFSFLDQPDDEKGKEVLARAKLLFPGLIEDAYDIKAPTGFIHAYDLTLLLVAAANKTEFSGDICKDRRRLRLALEDLDKPIHGLIKTYKRPFCASDEDHPDAHEALHIEDLVMAHYGERGEIIVIRD